MKIWTKPEYQLIEMNAEIGSYQEDFGDEPDPFVVAVSQPAMGGEPETKEVTAARDDRGVSAGGAAA